MIKNKTYWYVNMAGSVFGWLFLFYGIFTTLESDFAKTMWWIIFFAWGIGHPLELAISLPIGKKAGIPLKTTIIKTMMFGFTWWLPLKHGVIEE